MNYALECVFATPIYVALVDNIEEIKTEFNEVIGDIEFHNPPVDWGQTHKLTTIDFSDNIIGEKNMEVVMKAIDDHVKLYLEYLNYPYADYAMTSWITSFDKGEYAHVHNHQHADISGCYYYETNEEDGSIFFQPPSSALAASSVFHKFSGRWTHTPKEGKILMFPGWLSHGVTTNNTDNNRKSLSFNIYFKRF